MDTQRIHLPCNIADIINKPFIKGLCKEEENKWLIRFFL